VETKTVPHRDWRSDLERVAAIDGNTLRIPLANGNVFTFTTQRKMNDADLDVVVKTLTSWRLQLTGPDEGERFSLGSHSKST
jgi:hypothetical protein